MKFIFLIGVEGSGHHMITAILKEAIESTSFCDYQLFHQILTERWNSTDNSNKIIITNKLKSLFIDYENQGFTHIFESASFPFDQPRDGLRRPDIIELTEILESLKDIIDYRYLVLYRNPISATNSALRREFTDNILLQSKIIEDNLNHIMNQLKCISYNKYKILNFENFLFNPNSYSNKLAHWLGLNENTIINGLNNIRKPTQKEEIPANISEFLHEFFSIKRIKNWEEFFSHNTLI